MKRKITVFLPSLGYGGAEIITLRLLKGFIQNGLDVDLVIATPYVKIKDAIHRDVNIIQLGSRKATFSLFKLMRYMWKHKPEIVLSHLSRANRIALLAKYVTRSSAKLYVVEHTTRSVARNEGSFFHNLVTSLSYKLLYKYAEEVIHVSNGAARDLEAVLGWEHGKVKVAYNPVIDYDVIRSRYNVPHPWFTIIQIPVIVSIGRVEKPKDYITLIKAVQIVQKFREVRLLILGDGPDRPEVEKLIVEYDLVDKIKIVGFVDDPFSYLSNAKLFVLSSTREALPTVIIEAMACGCPVVSTNCRYGPSEILEDGIYGKLVPTGNYELMADAILRTLDEKIDRSKLKIRADTFSLQKATEQYLRILKLYD